MFACLFVYFFANLWLSSIGVYKYGASFVSKLLRDNTFYGSIQKDLICAQTGGKSSFNTYMLKFHWPMNSLIRFS